MQGLLAVMVGGALGSLARYLVASGVGRFTHGPFPWGTLAVNIIGGFVMGVLVEVMALKLSVSQEIRLFLTTGLMGGFTTFSAFSLESASMIERGDWSLAGLYAVSSVVGSILALFAALFLIRNLVA
jgi:CrcB protein